ncbi:DUF5937 family protein [Kitasatospora aureofaciens]|uniref:DUF5937 family protein n=1 Tax=Kitasatospora aureofaciens TaxID=1894 RepID=UPI001C4837A6|nr:DUF5937 family protein [Kitasatospora aureofaciens]MBV6698221.1 winged helix-turn-helix domain-containing protein [Kitasatospora aureofaciens]
MIRFEFTTKDLALTRFALSPLWEAVAAVRVLTRPAEHPLHRPWAEAARERLAAAGLDWGLLADLVPAPPRAIPVFVAPPPTTTVPDLRVELDVLRATPPETVRAALSGPRAPQSARVAALHADPDRGLAELADTVEAFWELTLAPYWPRIRALLEGDMLHRARLLARGGVQELLNDLDPQVTWDTDTLYVGHHFARGGRSLGGRGLLLVPSVFVWPRVFSVSTPLWQPTLRYPPRGVATLWERREREPSHALAAVLGRGRALLLAELDEPTSTAELARRTGMTPGGVSQHLTALRAAGLLSAHRAGRHVLYARTEAAEVLLSAAGG